MALIGATLTSDKADHGQAIEWIDAAEEWIFLSPDLCEEFVEETDDQSWEFEMETRLNALRAAYAIVLLMTWEGSCEQKKRARRTRFSQTIAVARSLCPSPVSHGCLRSYTDAGDRVQSWKKFILTEELIRTVLYVFMLDSAYVMFNNCAPRMVVFELQMSLTCPEVLFQVADVDIWLLYLEAWTQSSIGQRQPLLADIIEIILKEELSVEEREVLQQMSLLNFFSVVNGRFLRRPNREALFSVPCMISILC